MNRANGSLENGSFRPDFLFSAEPLQQRYNLVVLEAKPLKKATNGDLFDFIKLGMEMRIMLDAIIEDYPNIEDPEVFGILFQGNTM